MSITSESKLVRLPEVMEIFGYSRASIYRLAALGKIPKPVNLCGGSVFWVRTEINKFIDDKINEPRD
jgi:prophage regulatory protein